MIAAGVPRLLYGVTSGPKAGPFRWLFLRRYLLDIWEWYLFHAEPWMWGILGCAVSSAREAFPEDDVSAAHVLCRCVQFHLCVDASSNHF